MIRRASAKLTADFISHPRPCSAVTIVSNQSGSRVVFARHDSFATLRRGQACLRRLPTVVSYAFGASHLQNFQTLSWTPLWPFNPQRSSASTHWHCFEMPCPITRTESSSGAALSPLRLMTSLLSAAAVTVWRRPTIWRRSTGSRILPYSKKAGSVAVIRVGTQPSFVRTTCGTSPQRCTSTP